ncbi:MAG TPA: pyridoxal-dependent decarboxylase [Bryobacteraceae bacterium]|jgi:glutamate/tyrosine decarboxylase-like PLP-dependent enzyme/glutathione synthase/RimK-type ligase-like ATP-grasp enzyme|nr:pyridoxal-dependent decarboxylase [Bryobacteraceae bacterium]
MGTEVPGADLPPGMVTLDPPDWQGFRTQAHRMLDDILDYVENIRDRPVWQPIPDDARRRFRGALPEAPSDLAAVHREFMQYILPYATGNVHPGFMGWVHGGGTPVGLLAEMLAAGLNANLGGRDHIPIEVERQLVRWMQQLFGFPESATGLFVTGTSMANLIGILMARDTELGFEVRCAGVAGGAKQLAAYTSAAAHSCIGKAMDIAGIGSDALRLIPVGARHRIDVQALQTAVGADRRAGRTPFLVVGTAGTVDVGAIDDLDALAGICRRERLWFHIDGAYGALAILAPDLAPRLKGIGCADSLAFDFHKWGQVPYDAGFILVRDGVLHRQTFAMSAPYLRKELRGLAAGAPWPCDYGPDLSRGFRALKTWFTLKVHGAAALGSIISQTCALARYLESRIAETPELELLAPVELNVVCFGYRTADAQRVNPRIVIELQESGLVAPSSTVIGGRLAIRAAIVNHRTGRREIDLLIEKTVALGHALLASARASAASSTTPGDASGAEWPPHRALESALREIEDRIAREPGAVNLRFERACLLSEIGRTLEARNAYLDVLGREPGHRLALNNLGTLLYATGYRTAARTAYTEAVARHPGDPMGHVNLGNLLHETGEFPAAQEHYEAALRLDPGHLEAHQGLANVLAELGDEESAQRHRRAGFADRPVRALTYRGEGPPVCLLLLVSAAGGNIPTRYLLDDRVFQTFVLMPEFYDPKMPLPPHEVVFNAIGDADLAASALVAAQSVVALTSALVINRPAAVLATGRADHARLARLPGVRMPKTVTLPRALLSAPEAAATVARHGFGYPLLVRTPGFHTGRHFLRVESPEALPGAVAELPGKELTVIEFLNARGADGKVRKYRVMMIGGALYPLHVAISSHWKIHYFTADMAERADHRAEDAEFLANMPVVLGPRAMEALAHIQSTLGLDYAGIDFGLSTDGDLLLFEANATMVVNPPEPDERWAYRRPAIERIFSAVRNMLTARTT